MDIRVASQEHIPGILRLLCQVGEVHHRIRPDIFRSGALKYNGEALEKLLLEESKPIFVALEGESVLGYCFCQLRDHRGSTVLTDRVEVYIDDLCVEETCRGQGIAKQLYDHTCAWAKSLGCAFVTLNVWCGNENAMKFYEKLGMQKRSITMEAKL